VENEEGEYEYDEEHEKWKIMKELGLSAFVFCILYFSWNISKEHRHGWTHGKT
jgi:hypothetical protein